MMKFANQTENADTAAGTPIVKTSGEVFSDGCMIDVVASTSGSQPDLLFWDGTTTLIAPQVNYGGRIYQAQELQASILQAMRLPRDSVSYGTIQQLFTELRNAFEEYLGCALSLAQLSVYWILTTWFSDCLLSPPSLWASGTDIDVAASFLALLHCLSRRGLRLTGVTRSGFLSLPLAYCPTLLVHQPTLPLVLQDLWCQSNFRGLVVPGNGGVVLDATCSKAIFLGMFGFAPPPGASNLQIALFPPDHEVPPLDDRTLNAIADYFLPRLQKYRLDHAKQVRESRFEAPDLRFPTLELARKLGACIQGDPDLALQVVPLLREQEALVDRCNLDFAIVEVVLARLHRTTSESTAAGMKIEDELTADVNTFLLTCGGNFQYSREEVGKRVAKFEFSRKHTNAGTLLLLDRRTSRRVHQMARSYGIDISMPGCPDCQPVETSAQ
jgi:hypothetical protein